MLRRLRRDMRVLRGLCIGMLLAVTPFCYAQNVGTATSSQIEAMFEGIATDNTPGLAVLVRKDGQAVFERGYGVKELGSGSRVDTKTNFRLASVTKQFTAMAIMLLVHDEKLRYDETLTEIFPDFPAYGKNIKLYQLLTHTSGLPDYEELMEAAEKSGGAKWTPERQIQDDEVMALLKKETHGKFAPGSNWSYSNSGYVALGEIVAKISGKAYGDFLRERIFAPLKMADTIVYQKGQNTVSNRAFGYSKDGNGFKETDQSSTSATLGDGGIYSNLEDLAKWDDALQNHTLLSKNEMRAALIPILIASGAPHWPAAAEPSEDNLHPGKPVWYGFGWFLDPYKGHERMWHYGDTMGFKTAIQRFTKDGLTVIVLCNRTDLDPGALAMRAADLYLK